MTPDPRRPSPGDTGVWPVPVSAAADLAASIWIPVGLPGFSGGDKARRHAVLDERFGAGNWRHAHVVRGRVVPFAEAILEYEESYRQHLRRNRALVRLIVTAAGNVYDDDPRNVLDDDYAQPHTVANHYQDISVRRVIAELADDPEWPEVVDKGDDPAHLFDLTDLRTGETHRAPRAKGFAGSGLLQIRDAGSPGFALNPAVVPVHDPLLITTMPGRSEWYHLEGCGHLSVEAFWQMSKVVEVRYDRFLQLPPAVREAPLAGL